MKTVITLTVIALGSTLSAAEYWQLERSGSLIPFDGNPDSTPPHLDLTMLKPYTGPDEHGARATHAWGSAFNLSFDGCTNCRETINFNTDTSLPKFGFVTDPTGGGPSPGDLIWGTRWDAADGYLSGFIYCDTDQGWCSYGHGGTGEIDAAYWAPASWHSTRTLSVVPEPSAWVLLGVAFVLLTAIWRQRCQGRRTRSAMSG